MLPDALFLATAKYFPAGKLGYIFPVRTSRLSHEIRGTAEPLRRVDIEIDLRFGYRLSVRANQDAFDSAGG